jgi:hypothetical protein
LKPQVDILLAGPYIDFFNKANTDYNSSFDDFLTLNQITLIDYNNYEIVNKTFTNIKNSKKVDVDEFLDFDFKGSSKADKLAEIIKNILKITENTIVYCSSRSGVETYAKKTNCFRYSFQS